MPTGLKHLLITVVPFIFGALLIDIIGHKPFSIRALCSGFFCRQKEMIWQHTWFHSSEFLLVMWSLTLGLSLHFILDKVGG